jgi:NAD(P)H-nitrite reductase large subunit
MAGTPLKLAGEVAYNVMPVFDCTAAFMERRDDGDEETEVYQYMDEYRSAYRKILVKKDRVVGAVMLGAYKDAGVMLHLLKKRINVAHLKEHLASGRAIWGDLIKRM